MSCRKIMWYFGCSGSPTDVLSNIPGHSYSLGSSPSILALLFSSMPFVPSCHHPYQGHKTRCPLFSSRIIPSLSPSVSRLRHFSGLSSQEKWIDKTHQMTSSDSWRTMGIIDSTRRHSLDFFVSAQPL